MKFLYFSDFHLCDRQPLHRLDNYYETQLLKLRKIFSLSKECAVDVIISNGDLIDKGVDSFEFLADILKEFLQNKIPFYHILGNHDVCGYQLNSRWGFINVLEKLGLITVPDKSFEIKDLTVYCYHYTKEIPKSLGNLKKKGKYICCVHNMVLPNQSLPYTFLPVEDIKTTGQLILCGHYHHPFHKKLNNTTFLNVGSLGRLKIDEAGYVPQIAIIDVENNDIELIPIGEEGSLVFEKVEKDEKNKYSYIETKSIDFSGVESAWDLLKGMTLDKAVYDECGDRLSQAEKILK